MVAWTSNSTRQIFMLFMCFILASCAPAVTLPLTPDQTPAPLDSRWQKLRGGNQVRSALRAMADIDLMADVICGLHYCSKAPP
jgi:hypothetical protein